MKHPLWFQAHTYRLAHSGHDGSLPREIEFEGRDAAAALFEAQRLAPAECPVLIKEDGQEIATVRLSADGFWSVSATVVGDRLFNEAPTLRIGIRHEIA